MVGRGQSEVVIVSQWLTIQMSVIYIPRRNWIDISDLWELSTDVPLLVVGPVSKVLFQLYPRRSCDIMSQISLHVEERLTFSSSSYGEYHLDNRVFPCRF